MAFNSFPEWNKLVFTKSSAEDRAPNLVANLPPYKETVLVTDGRRVWLDIFDEDTWLYLMISNKRVTEVIAWMYLPQPYKEATHDI